MKLKTSYVIWGAAVLIGLAQGENVRSSLAKGSKLRQQQTEFSDRIRTNRTEAREAEKLSKVALDRYRANCILVVDKDSSQDSYFQEGELVVEPRLNRSIRPGASVCNKLGDTAVVDGSGRITDIARVATPDLAQFKKLLEQKNGAWK